MAVQFAMQALQEILQHLAPRWALKHTLARGVVWQMERNQADAAILETEKLKLKGADAAASRG